MTGPEHYLEAQRQIDWAQSRGETDPDTERVHLKYSQVHATLALAAATALPEVGRAEDRQAWIKAAGVEL